MSNIIQKDNYSNGDIAARDINKINIDELSYILNRSNDFHHYNNDDLESFLKENNDSINLLLEYVKSIGAGAQEGRITQELRDAIIELNENISQINKVLCARKGKIAHYENIEEKIDFYFNQGRKILIQKNKERDESRFGCFFARINHWSIYVI